MKQHDELIRAVHLATRKLASNGTYDLLMKDVLVLCVEAVGASGGTIYLHDPTTRRLKFQHVLPEEILDKLPAKDIADDYGMAGEAFQTRSTIIRTFPPRAESERNTFEKATGVTVNTMLCTPLMMEQEEPIGVVALINKLDGQFDSLDSDVLDTISAVSTMAFMNARLTEESTRASTLLGMGKVSHDIGNLAASLYATLSFGDMMMQGLKEHMRKAKPDATVSMFVEGLDPLVNDLKHSVDRIVGYARLISDLSAGRELRPELRLGTMSETIQTSAMYLEADARANHVSLRYDIDEEAPATQHDSLYIFRIVQNLVGNAIKAVREIVPSDVRPQHPEESLVYGDVLVRYAFINETHLIEVTDSGPGMTRETAERILSGNARSQWGQSGGSGWGTKIVLELTATHEGKVSIESEIGIGTTFRVALPHRP
ncbi:MAG: ATP-binding protein [Fimbriimonas sp.]